MIRRALHGLRRRRDASPAAQIEAELARADPGDRPIIERCLPYTMTGVPRLQALIDAVRYCERAAVPGAFAECGVWRGGSVVAMITTLQALGNTDRDIYLYDTFEGMTKPTERDVSQFDRPGLEIWEQADGRPWPEFFDPQTFNQETVRATVAGTGYPEERLHFVAGAIEDTVPDHAPEQLALLRLDTDWYESTWHELVHLYPRLHAGGVLIVDDYGHWEGCMRAVDAYFDGHAPPVLLSRIDYAGRLAIKR